VTLLVVIGLVALFPLGLYFYVDRSMHRVQALTTDGPEVLAPQLQAGLQNYLVVGSGVPGEKGPASVAMLLASVSADGTRAVLLTLPPTALVDTPECRTANGGLREPRSEALAASLLAGAPGCTVRAVQQFSGLRIDHFLDLDLGRLPGMVDALGGVPVCVEPSAAVAAASRPLPAGGTRLSGSQAAAYLRPADAAADATGAQVAQRTSLLLTATLHAALSRSSLTSPVALTRFLKRAAAAMTVDDGTTLGDLRGLGGSLGSLSGGAVQRAGLPLAQVGYVPAGSKQSYVLLDEAATRSLFDSVIGRTRLPAGYAAGAASPAPSASPGTGGDAPAGPSAAPSAPAGPAAPGVSVPPGSVTVDVLNGTATTGLAAKAAAAMQQQGFAVGKVDNAQAAVDQTVVRYGPEAQEQAKTVAAAVPGSVLQADPAAGNGVQLVVGPGWNGAVPVQVSAPTAAPTGSAAASPSPAARATASCG
jgi:LCP family protein required for cell wall assembly